MSKPEDVVGDELVLAGVERAQRHAAEPGRGVPVWAIREHLDIPKRTARSRQLAARLDVLEAGGELERGRRRSVTVYGLTGTGRRRLADARGAGVVPGLPESPQYRAWQQARMLAAREVDRLPANARDVLAEADRLFEAEPPVHSDEWFELAERLHRVCRLLGSITHCLYEWAEPDDEHADIDGHIEPGDELLAEDERARRVARRAGRRNTNLWRRADR